MGDEKGKWVMKRKKTKMKEIAGKTSWLERTLN
jgi:hypothetical protein